MEMMRANKEATPAMRNRPQKLARLRLAEETWLLEFVQLFCCPSHAFSISFLFFPSVTFKIALDTSDTKGEPIGKTCKSLKKINMRNYTLTQWWSQECSLGGARLKDKIESKKLI